MILSRRPKIMNLPNLEKYNGSQYNEDYYEHGVKTKTSGYENYRWMPTRSYPEAIEIINKFPNVKTIIDYGCGKGFLVHALRQLGKLAFGEDISDYAINHCHPMVKNYLSKPSDNKADLIICKDILEHIYEQDMQPILELLKSKIALNGYLFIVVPLGDNNLFRIREYEIDITHVTKKDEDWWINQFNLAGLKLQNFVYSIGAIKEKWIPVHPYGNGFFILTK